MREYVCALGITMLVWAPAAAAQSPFNPSKSMRTNLQAFADGKQVVTVVLSNGKEYRGRVGAVADEAVVLTGIVGREFFDVLIDSDAIVAIEAQARQQ